MELPDFLEREEFGFIRLKGHRIGLDDVVYCYNEGYSPEMIQDEYPTLSLPHIHKTIAFYLEHQADVDRYISEEEAACERNRLLNPPRGPDLTELKRRREQRIRAKGA
jgi:uncharacterized protein (DUF433 family)